MPSWETTDSKKISDYTKCLKYIESNIKEIKNDIASNKYILSTVFPILLLDNMTTCEKADIILQNKLIFDHINNFKDTKFFMNEILKIMTNNPEKISTEEAINIVMHLNKKLK
ncbi:hypothetical protein HZS_7703, partial [Henneguya salminicola]